MSFDPKPYLKNLGNERQPRWYLQAAHRVLWFRTEHPQGSIITEPVQFDPFPVFKATVTNGEGQVLANSYGSAQVAAGKVYAGREIEKAETAAIARALGLAGYGSQFSGDDEDDSDHIAESPVEKRAAPKAEPKPVNPFGNEAAQVAINNALRNHQMDSDEGKAFVYTNINPGVVYKKFSEMFADDILPADVLTQLPALAARYHLSNAMNEESTDGDPFADDRDLVEADAVPSNVTPLAPALARH